MTGRPRTPHGGGTDDGGTPSGPHRRGEETPTPRAHAVGSVAQAQEAIAALFRAGRSNSTRNTVDGSSGSDVGTPAPNTNADDVALQQVMDRYHKLGSEPPRFNVANNDALYRGNGAHTIDRHSPDISLPRDPNAKTLEGRIYGDRGWDRPENWSLHWTDHTTMNREINNYVQQNWKRIRSDLALEGQHGGAFNAAHRVGDGYYNNGMYGVGPRQAQYTAASLVRITIELVDGADPPQAFIVTAYPAGVLPPGLL
jgi:hypothetical protein